MHSAFRSAESEALHSAERYGPLKTRLYHRTKHYGPLKARLKDHGKISNFCTFLLHLDFELLLRSFRSNYTTPSIAIQRKVKKVVLELSKLAMLFLNVTVSLSCFIFSAASNFSCLINPLKVRSKHTQHMYLAKNI